MAAVFTRNADWYHLTELVVCADGAVDAGGGPADLDGLRADLESGRVVTRLEDGIWASVHEVGSWRISDPVGGRHGPQGLPAAGTSTPIRATGWWAANGTPTGSAGCSR
ncbi:hypothetical protein [Actinoplanes sp. TFC3]|uniref:DUF7638 domain-containing protein n=1 Tax=Actinoplanes sp. TFC3 TaxID=1710355 RepID=UPI0012902035|nr:hypothetical protein [Actinoplanes sp. TFC3]